MNNNTTRLLLLMTLLWSSLAYSQGFQLDPNSYTYPSNGTRYLSCDSIVDMTMSINDSVPNNTDFNTIVYGTTSFSPFEIEVMVDWGDGNTTIHTGFVSTEAQALNLSPTLSHTYSSTGNYTITYAITNVDNSSFSQHYFTTNVNTCSQEITAAVQVDCDSNFVFEQQLSNNVPFILSNSNYSYSTTLINNLLLLTNVEPGTYDIEIDPTWLAVNGYNAYYSPMSVYIDTSYQAITTQTVLICDTIQNPTNTQCVFGQVYCDADSNGVFDQGIDIPIANAPVWVYPVNGSPFTVHSDPNGHFQGTYSGGVGGASYYINWNWAQQNGYGALPGEGADTLTTSDCDSLAPMANIALTCPPPNPTNNCTAGYVFCDDNNNGVFDNGEMPIANAPVNLNFSTYSDTIVVYTDSNGYYFYCGNYMNMEPVVAYVDGYWVNQHGYASNNPYQTNQMMANPHPYATQLALDCGTTSTCADLYTSVTPWIGYYQNQTNYIKLNWGNYGPIAPGDYQLTLEFPAGVTPVTSSIMHSNYTISGNTITWVFNSNSSNFVYSDVIYFDTPSGIPSGTAHHFTSNIVPLNGGNDCNLSNNASCLLQIVGNSYDPNDKLVDQLEIIDPAITDTLTYTIRFQNTGTAPAQDVYIIDTISSNLQYGTLEIISRSHNMNLVEMGNSVVKFDFPQIWLPDSNANEPESHGYVTYRIIEKASNTEGSIIENTAHIYFDWNPAIVTNTTYNINTVNNSIIENDVKNEVLLFPNPSKDILNIISHDDIQRIDIYSLNGQLVKSLSSNTNREVVTIGDLTNGVYVVKVTSNNNVSIHKVIKQ